MTNYKEWEQNDAKQIKEAKEGRAESFSNWAREQGKSASRDAQQNSYVYAATAEEAEKLKSSANGFNVTVEPGRNGGFRVVLK